MKNVALFALVLSCFATGVVRASVDPVRPSVVKVEKKKGKVSLKDIMEAKRASRLTTMDMQITDLLRMPRTEVMGDAVVKVKFVINSDNQIVVLDVQSDKKWASTLVEGRLHGQQLLNVRPEQKKRYYYMPVVLQR